MTASAQRALLRFLSPRRARAGFILLALACAGCAQLPKDGPSSVEIEKGAGPGNGLGLQIVELDAAVASRLADRRRQKLFSEALGEAAAPASVIGPGDTLEVAVWEAPPSTLFGVGLADPSVKAPLATARPMALPEQVVDANGMIPVPFAGRVVAAGRTVQAVEEDITERLHNKAHQPEVIVTVMKNASSVVTVVGEVTSSLRMPLTSGGERLLDALAAAGGVRQPVNKTTVQVTRGNGYHALPLDLVIRDPRQNVPLHAGDVVTAIFQPLSFTALGATGKNEEINFEAQGITLAQAIARSGGLLDARSNARGVFVFRFEPAAALDWPRAPVMATPDGRVPVIYRLDLSDPSSFFVMQNFAMDDKDVLYVSNAPLAELQKFINIVFSVGLPFLSLVQTTR